MPERPWFKFFRGDWRSDPGLRLCSAAARGVWIEVICLLYDGNPCGTLTSTKGEPLTPEQVARSCSLMTDEVVAGLAELEANDVFARAFAKANSLANAPFCQSVLDENGAERLLPDGVIFSRKIVRDAQLSEKRSSAGRQGAFAKHFAIANSVAKCGSGSGSGSNSDSGLSGSGSEQSVLPGTEPEPVAPPRKPRARASSRPRVEVDPDLRQVLDAHQRFMLEHRSAVYVTPATTANLDTAAQVLTAAGGDVQRAVRLVELYVKLADDEFIERCGWAFKWLPSRCAKLAVVAGRRDEKPASANRRQFRETVDAYIEQGLTDEELVGCFGEEQLREFGCWPPRRKVG